MIIIIPLITGSQESKEKVYIEDFPIAIQSLIETYEGYKFFTDFQIRIEVLNRYDYSKIENFLRAYKYYQLVELTQEDLIKKDKFLTDYHTVKFIANDGGIDRINVALSLVGLSNLLRLASEFGIDEIHAVSLRIFRKRSEVLNKDVFIITEY
ncbi:MAG: hypothetical protein QXS63_01085 [Zestosphaera sp.]